MRRAWLVVRALAAGFVVSMPVWANAPITGTAAQYQPFDSSNATILDRKTRLKWQRAVDPTPTNFASAKCTTGRLPTLKELLTIFDEQPFAYYNGSAYEDRFVDQPAFGKEQNGPERTPAGAFWTSSFVKGTDKVWVVDFKMGEVSEWPVSAPGYTRCVDTW